MAPLALMLTIFTHGTSL